MIYIPGGQGVSSPGHPIQRKKRGRLVVIDWLPLVHIHMYSEPPKKGRLSQDTCTDRRASLAELTGGVAGSVKRRSKAKTSGKNPPNGANMYGGDATLSSGVRQETLVEGILEWTEITSGAAGGINQRRVTKTATKTLPNGSNFEHCARKEPPVQRASYCVVVYQPPGRWSSVGKTCLPVTKFQSRGRAGEEKLIVEEFEVQGKGPGVGGGSEDLEVRSRETALYAPSTLSKQVSEKRQSITMLENDTKPNH